MCLRTSTDSELSTFSFLRLALKLLFFLQFNIRTFACESPRPTIPSHRHGNPRKLASPYRASMLQLCFAVCQPASVCVDAAGVR